MRSTPGKHNHLTAIRRAQAALLHCSFFPLRALRVIEDEGRVLISGEVSCFNHKQRAQDLVRAALPGVQVVNQVVVVGR